MILPLKYNVRNVLVRWRSTLATVIGIALVVSVFVLLRALARGIEITSANTGDARENGQRQGLGPGDRRRESAGQRPVGCEQGAIRPGAGHGFTVAAASSGAEALSQAENFAPDLILLDLGLPGFKLVRQADVHSREV